MNQAWSLGKVVRVVLYAMLLAGLAACTFVTIGVVRLSQRQARVETAVKASFPAICTEVAGTLEIKAVPLSWYTVWEVNCINSYRPGTIRQFEVNVLTCRARLAVEATGDWRQMVTNWFRASLPMEVCP
jgi:hypothetical protein